LLAQHSRLQHAYLRPLLHALWSEDRLKAYGSVWSDYLLRAKTKPQPPIITEELARMSYLAGIPPTDLARRFSMQEHI
jgi:hypothetical protein